MLHHFWVLMCFWLTSVFCGRSITLPSYSGPSLDMYTGYITVDPIAGRSLFYWLVKAEKNSNTAPLIVWFQGGPGCSGLFGLFMENGPLRVKLGTNPGETKVTYNHLGWTQFANLLFVEQPAFVGFSFSNNASDINTGDHKAANDNKKFLELFVTQEFKEFYGRDLWFAGESYGGVYVPTVTDLILKDKRGILYPQFKGFMLGNPVFSCQDGFIESSGAYLIEEVNLLYWHGLASYTNYKNWTDQGCNQPKVASQPKCTGILDKIKAQVGVINQEKRSINPPSDAWPSLDPDAIFQDFCTGNATLAFADTPTAAAPCPEEMGILLTNYLNRRDVQVAIFARPTVWESCNPRLNYKFEEISMIPLYENFFVNKPSIRILVFSGDQDILTVPFAFTTPCIAKLSGKIVSEWQPWFVNGATAGYVEVYDKYTFATVKGGGHETPLYQPLISFEMAKRFLFNGALVKEGERCRVLNRKIWRQRDMLRAYKVIP